MNELQIKQETAKKMMLWVGMISMSAADVIGSPLSFIGLSSVTVP